MRLFGLTNKQINWLYDWYNTFQDGRNFPIPEPSSEHPYVDIIFLKHSYERVTGDRVPMLEVKHGLNRR